MSEEVESLRWYDGGPPFYVAPTLTKPRACDTAIEWVVNLAFLRLNLSRYLESTDNRKPLNAHIQRYKLG